MVDTYTHKDLASLCSVSETTIKSYRRKFPGFIPVLTRGKPIRFKKEAGDVCLTIRDCFEKGMSVRETGKILKKNFKEERTAPTKTTRPASSPSAVSDEYLEKFFKTAGQMMQGMASMATAQAKTGQRLEKLEKAVSALIETETRNSELYAQLLTQQTRETSEETSAPPKSSSVPTSEPKTEKVRARKIVNVKSSEGDVKSYSLEKEEKNTTVTLQAPPEELLSSPIVILNTQGEFLGVPGRLSLSGFVEILTRESEEVGASRSSWRQDNSHWVYTMDAPGGDSHELFFASTTTPRGNLVALLDRLDVNNKQTSPQFLQEFFRQIKDKI
jgi:DNA-binding transcriptional MerR regulator